MAQPEVRLLLFPPPCASAGRMYLFYGNKTSVQFQNFMPAVVHPGDLQTHILWLCPAPEGPEPVTRCDAASVCLGVLVFQEGR